jgi:hypothetical protein
MFAHDVILRRAVALRGIVRSAESGNTIAKIQYVAYVWGIPIHEINASSRRRVPHGGFVAVQYDIESPG